MTAMPTTYLLVEDDRDYADLVRLTLARINPTAIVEHLDDGEQAISYLEQLAGDASRPAPTVILLDLNLPRVDGHDVLAYIKTTPSLRTIPTILLTSSAANEDRVRAFDLHVNSVLTKPGDFAELQDMLEAVDRFWTKWNRTARAA